ncbi:MAG: hypothetical protein BJ554DRAFT_7259, partial [Olpidium bornovanus]
KKKKKKKKKKRGGGAHRDAKGKQAPGRRFKSQGFPPHPPRFSVSSLDFSSVTTWLDSQTGRRKYCPICKALCRETSLVPLFVDWASSEETSRPAQKVTREKPPHPATLSAPSRPYVRSRPGNLTRGSFLVRRRRLPRPQAAPFAAQVWKLVRVFSDRAQRLGRDKADLLLDKSKLLAEIEAATAMLLCARQSSAALAADLKKLRHCAKTLTDDRRILAKYSIRAVPAATAKMKN